jgi:hypothetical protein
MKAMEILSESKKLDEAPASMLGQVARRAGAGVLGAMGLNTLASQINDKADVGMFANRYYKEFTNYLKTRNRDPKRATFGDLKSFMTKNKIPTHNVPSNPGGSASKDMVNSILTQTANEYLSGASVGSSRDSSVTASQKKQNQPKAAVTSNSVVNNQKSTSTVNTIPKVKVDDLVNQISQLNAKQLSKIEQAVQSAKAAMPTAAAAKTPADIRAEKQAKAAQSARSQMTPVSATQTPAEIRAEKQAKAAQTAQAQMSATPTGQTKPVVASRRRRKRKQLVPAV